jgi:hypothetical protein
VNNPPPRAKPREPPWTDVAARRELTVRLAEAEAVALPEERIAIVSDALAVLLGLAATLDGLPLDGVQPAFGSQTWD